MQNTKVNRMLERKAWISGQVTEQYKDLEILAKDDPYIVLSIWKGTAGKPFVHYCYQSTEQRDNAIVFYKKRADEREEYKLKQKEAKKEIVSHNLKKGDIFVTSWGYDQTNYDYIVVMEISPSKKTAICQRTSSLHQGQANQCNVQEPIFCPFGDKFRMQIRKGYNGDSVNLVGSYPFCYDGEGSKRKGYFSPHIAGSTYSETMMEFGH